MSMVVVPTPLRMLSIAGAEHPARKHYSLTAL